MFPKSSASPWRLEDVDDVVTMPSRPPIVETDDDRRERLLVEEMRPLIDSLERLRERDLLD